MIPKNKKTNYIAIAIALLACISHYVSPKLPIAPLLFFIAVMYHAYTSWGEKRAALFATTAIIIGYFAELIGINTGWIFGQYHYNPENFGMIYGVPVFIPVMYVVILYSINLTVVAISEKLSHKHNLWILAALTGFVATLKDTVTDPLRSTLSSVWIWTDGGQYFGVPIHNFFGWFLVFFVMTMVVGHLSIFSKSSKLKTDKNFLLFPVVLFTLQAIMAIIANINVPETQKALGQVGSYMGLFTLTPFILLAWLNSFKKEKA